MKSGGVLWSREGVAERGKKGRILRVCAQERQTDRQTK